MILADNETKVDFLNNEAIATTIIALLKEQPDKPLTIGVHGDWGAGKSSVLEMIESGLDQDKDVLCIKFNGWRYQGFEDAKIALLESIVTSLVEKRPASTKAADAAKEAFKRINWLKLAKVGGAIGWNAFTGTPAPGQVQAVVETVKGWIGNPNTLPSAEEMGGAVEKINGFLKPAEPKHVPEEVEEFRKAFKDLLKAADVNRLVILVDDLDRCLPNTAIETLEAIRLFLFTESTAFVVAADEAMIQYAVKKHFPELPATEGPRDYSRNYLEKLIQIPFRIPALGETETHIYITLLLVGSVLGEDDPDFVKLVAAAREKLKRPWEATPFDPASVRAELSGKADSVQDMLMMGDQLGPILASGSQGNPRQIKRFINALLLRKSIAIGRGFGDDVKLPVLAKLMLAERFIPTLFDEIAGVAAVSADGACAELADLEAANGQKPTASKKHEEETPRVPVTGVPAKKAAKKPSQTLQSWLNSDSILEWGALEPKLASIDLRPYLFVAKDKKDYFGSSSALDSITDLAQRLLGAKITVQGMSKELQKLTTIEANQVFELVRQRILMLDDFRTQPAGRDGLVVLVTAQPSLEADLLDLLDSLPTDNLGTWIVSGWNACLKDPASSARFNGLLNKWATIKANGPLSAAAKAVVSIGNTRT